jgi:hypothetical protein
MRYLKRFISPRHEDSLEDGEGVGYSPVIMYGSASVTDEEELL